MNSKDFANTISELIFTKKGYDVKIIDLKKLTTFADYFVICSADSDTQVKAIADEIDKSLRDEGIKCWHKEGYMALQWVLLDYVDVVVHVFKKTARDFYNLEKLWGDAQIIEVVDPLLKPKKETSLKKKTIRKTTTVKKKA
ncbi:MAG: ribosome silencing factor [Ignavibacteriaceae bacterium]|nr:ribosome silencing factor [Ignavibacteriaceae bacterium]